MIKTVCLVGGEVASDKREEVILEALRHAMKSQLRSKRPVVGLSVAGLRHHTNLRASELRPKLNELVERGVLVTSEASSTIYRLRAFRDRV